MKTSAFSMRTAMVPFVVVAIVVAAAHGAFLDAYESSFVVQVDPASFNEKVMEYDGTVLVQFYTTWSPNCKRFAPVWVETAEVLAAQGSSTRLAILDADAHREFARRFKVDGYPTIASFGRRTKVLPQYDLVVDGPNSLRVDDILAHVAALESVTENEAKQKLADIEKVRAFGSAPSTTTGFKEEPAAFELPPEVATLEERRQSLKAAKKISSKRSNKDGGLRPSADLGHDAEEDDVILSPRKRSPRDPHIPSHGAMPDIKHPRIPKFESPGLDEHLLHPHMHRGVDGDDDVRKRPPPPPPSPEDEARHKKMVEEHWERVRQRKEEREDRRKRGQADEHDEMYFRHERMIEESRRRHEEHLATVMKRHEEAMAAVQQQLNAHKETMRQRLDGFSPEQPETPAASPDDVTAGGDLREEKNE